MASVTDEKLISTKKNSLKTSASHKGDNGKKGKNNVLSSSAHPRGTIRTKDFIFKIQKKVLTELFTNVNTRSIISNKNGLSHTDKSNSDNVEGATNLLNAFYELLCRENKIITNRKEGLSNKDRNSDVDFKLDAHKLVKHVIKISIKMALLFRNDRFNEEELNFVKKLQYNFKVIAMTLISFSQISYSYDGNHLIRLIRLNQEFLKGAVSRHLKAKSMCKIEKIYETLTDKKFLEAAFLETPLESGEEEIDKTTLNTKDYKIFERDGDDDDTKEDPSCKLVKFSQSRETQNFINVLKTLQF